MPISRALRLLILLLAALCPGCAGFVVKQFAFHPERVPASQPEIRSPGIEELQIESTDGTMLQAFFFENETSNRAVIYLHGNAGNAYHRLGDAREIAGLDANVLLLSYRGYGKSQGSPSERGVYRDGEAALRWLEARGYPRSRILILGRSIGSAVAVEVARNAAEEQPIAGLILVTPLLTGREVARAHGLGWIAWLAGRPFDNGEKIAEVDCPLLLVHGDQDRVIPIEQGLELFERHPGPKQLLRVPGANHQNVLQVAGEEYRRRVEATLAGE